MTRRIKSQSPEDVWYDSGQLPPLEITKLIEHLTTSPMLIKSHHDSLITLIGQKIDTVSKMISEDDNWNTREWDYMLEEVVPHVAKNIPYGCLHDLLNLVNSRKVLDERGRYPTRHLPNQTCFFNLEATMGEILEGLCLNSWIPYTEYKEELRKYFQEIATAQFPTHLLAAVSKPDEELLNSFIPSKETLSSCNNYEREQYLSGLVGLITNRKTESFQLSSIYDLLESCLGTLRAQDKHSFCLAFAYNPNTPENILRKVYELANGINKEEKKKRSTPSPSLQ